MAYYANKYQYEASPRKLKPDYNVPKKTYPKKSSAKSTDKNNKQFQKINQARIILYIAIGFLAFFFISYRYAIIDKTYANLKELKTELAMVEKETAQLEANIESSLKLTTIEEKAKEQLGMQKLNSEQIVYVTLPKTDYVECSSEEIQLDGGNQNWFICLIKKIMNILN